MVYLLGNESRETRKKRACLPSGVQRGQLARLGEGLSNDVVVLPVRPLPDRILEQQHRQEWRLLTSLLDLLGPCLV